MIHKPFKIYKSSAGSGKTFTLVLEYLLLALKSPRYYKHILAVTFTKKATAEMKDRIISTLTDIAHNRPNPMTDELKNALKIDNKALENKANNVLSAILHGYGHFAVTNIDSFFQKIVAAFTKEIGVQGRFQIELDQQKVLAEVIDLLIGELKDGDDLIYWLNLLANEKIEENKSWNIKAEIKAVGNELFTEKLKKIRTKLEDFATDRSRLKDFQNELYSIIISLENKMKEFGQKGLKIIEDNMLEITDFPYGKSGVAGYFLKITKKDNSKRKENYQYGTRVEKGLSDSSAWFTNKSEKKEQIEQLAITELMPLLNETIKYYENNKKLYLSTDIVSKHFKSFAVLIDLSNRLKQFRTDENILLISDIGELLKRIVADYDAPFIYEKTGSFYKNYLIDEFQDTSGFQWDNFYPLVANSIAEGNMSMVVGDAKQSIYRWRGADPMILQQHVQDKIGTKQIQQISLNTNYRSAENIINFNNTLFHNIVKLLPSDPNLSVGISDINDIYSDVEQHFPKSKSSTTFKGYIEFSFMPSEKEAKINWKDKVLKKLPQQLELLQDQGVGIEEIAIITRKNAHSKLVMDAMMEYQQSNEAKEGYSYALISNETLKINNAKVVNILLNTLRYLQDPDNQVARANLAYDYQHIIKRNKEMTIHQLFSEKYINNYLPQSFVNRHNELIKLPLYDLTEELIRMFELSTFVSQVAYLQAFQDAVLNYSTRHTSDILQFIKWWEDKDNNQILKISTEVNAAQVITIHKSKGLQFRAVILPFVDWNVEPTVKGNSTNFIWNNNETPPFDKLPTIPIDYKNGLEETVFDKDYYQEMVSGFLDNINLLYVACTRAKEYLIGFAESNAKKSISDLLCSVLPSNPTLSRYWDDKNQQFRYGTLKSITDKKMANNLPNAEPYLSNSWKDKLKVKYRGEQYFGENYSQNQGISFGNLLHDLMSRVVTLDQLPIALDDMLHEGLIDSLQMKQLQDTTLKLTKSEKIKGWFDPHWQVKTEIPILPTTGQMRRPDRVMISNEIAIVVDYKTGTPKRKDIQQIAEYKDLISQMGYKNVEGYVLYLDKMEIVAAN